MCLHFLGTGQVCLIWNTKDWVRVGYSFEDSWGFGFVSTCFCGLNRGLSRSYDQRANRGQDSQVTAT